MTDPHEDDVNDEVARRFRENETLGDSSSFWYRATRAFFEEQKPIGKFTVLCTGPTQEQQTQLGVFTLTEKDRLVYWPALSKGKQKVTVGSRTLERFDHITLEFPSERMHLTYYDANGKKKRLGAETRTFRLPGANLAMCFEVLVEVDVLKNQDLEIQRSLNVDASHRERMTEWMRNFATSVTPARTKLTADYMNRNYLHYSIILDPHLIEKEHLPPIGNLLTNAGLERFVDGWKSDEGYGIDVSRFSVGTKTLLFAAGCPHGTLRHPVAFLIARRRTRKPKKDSED